jgi:hypothetical protein
MTVVGTFRTCRHSLTMSGHRGKADIPPRKAATSVFGPNADMSRRRIGGANAILGANPGTARAFGLEVPPKPLAQRLVID